MHSLNRRRFLRNAAIAVAATQVGLPSVVRARVLKSRTHVAEESLMTSFSAGTPNGPGSVTGAPNLPAGFSDTFTSSFIDTNGVRLHAVIGTRRVSN